MEYAAAEAKTYYPNILWNALSGTSHATPLVSRCAAVLREILQSKGCPRPRAALLKSLLMNGAEKLPGVAKALAVSIYKPLP